jgi:hypothetical protein
LRLAIVVELLRRALRALRERGDVLAGLLLAAGLMDLATGQWGQATVSGFAIFTAGLCLAASGDHEEETEAEDVPEAPRRIRGRGVFAERIRGERQ